MKNKYYFVVVVANLDIHSNHKNTLNRGKSKRPIVSDSHDILHSVDPLNLTDNSSSYSVVVAAVANIMTIVNIVTTVNMKLSHMGHSTIQIFPGQFVGYSSQ